MKINNPFPQHDRNVFTAVVIRELLCPIVTSLYINPFLHQSGLLNDLLITFYATNLSTQAITSFADQ